MLQLCASSLVDTHAIAGHLAALSRPGDVLILSGEMGSGKTAFAQGFGAALGVTEPITSPTFTLVHSYDCGKVTLHHADLYRLERTTEVADLALAELAEFNGIVLVEWGEVVDNGFGDHLVVLLEPVDELDGDDDIDGVGGDGGEIGVADDGEIGVADDGGAGPAGDVGGDDGGTAGPADERRRIELAAVGASWAARWPQIVARCEPYRC